MVETVSAMEKQFTEVAEFSYTGWRNPYMSVVSSGCLICMIWGRQLYLANLGDSRAILCSNQLGCELDVHPMLRDHNCRNVEIREELQALHGHDDAICSNVFGEWRVKGLSETSRCIGNAYLKKADFTIERGFEAPPGEKVTSIFTEPVLSAEPEFYTRDLDGTEKFIIFGSGGFWKLLTNEEAAKIVNDHPRGGVAKRLAAQAVKIAAERWGLTYREVMLAPKGVKISGEPNSSEIMRPLYHDDITVIVVYLDLNLPVTVDSKTYNSYRSHSDSVVPSVFGGPVEVDDKWDYGKIDD
ncbi:Protein phosphatase 2C family protein [Trifolium repens]|nr:Protein phosphatase 2C family protein [Trifolium repens]